MKSVADSLKEFRDQRDRNRMSDAELFRWAAEVMSWERAQAKARGGTIPRVRGITELHKRVQRVMTSEPGMRRERSLYASRIIEHAVRRAYRLGIE